MTEIIYEREHTKEAIKQRGEVFTPLSLVNEMLDKLPLELFTDKTKTFLDNSCGTGNFLIEVLKRKMSNGATHKEALLTIYGCDIDQKNVDECCERLLMGKNGELKLIVYNNIICANALDENHPGWKNVGYMWDENKKPAEVYHFDFNKNWGDK
jgi:SAM-dependent methyltransferase